MSKPVWIEGMEKPTNVNRINKEFILEFAKRQTPAEKAWIMHTYERAIAVNTKTQGSFFTLRKEFVERYCPEILAKNKPKKECPTFLSELKAVCE